MEEQPIKVMAPTEKQHPVRLRYCPTKCSICLKLATTNLRVVLKPKSGCYYRKRIDGEQVETTAVTRQEVLALPFRYKWDSDWHSLHAKTLIILTL